MKKYILLSIGLLAISCAAIILKCLELNSFAISFWRLLISSLIFLMLSTHKKNIVSDIKKNAKTLFYASFFMGAHFILWITAFSYTDLSSNVILIVFQPISALFLGYYMFSEHITFKKVVAIFIALAGLWIIIKDDLSISADHVFGDILGLLGTFSITLFYTFTKKMKSKMSFLNFIGLSFFFASLWCLGAIVISQKPLLITEPNDYLFMTLLVLFPTLTGHALLNYCTHFFSLFSLNISIIAEPFLAIIFSYVIFGTVISLPEIIGGSLLVTALLIGVYEKKSQTVCHTKFRQ